VNFTLGTCNYCTPDITLTMLKSFRFYHPKHTDIIVCENSPIYIEDEHTLLRRSCNYITLRFPQGRHETSVDTLIENTVTKYLLLVDSDIIFLNNCLNSLQLIGTAAVLGKITGDRGGKRIRERVDPWFCLIDCEQIKEHKIKFYDDKRFWKNTDDPNIRRYDVGSSFLEDVKKAGLGVVNIDLGGLCFRHYEGMSWWGSSADRILKEKYEHKIKLYSYEIRKFKNVSV